MNSNSFSALIFFLIALMGGVIAYSIHASPEDYNSYIVFGVAIFIAYVISSSILTMGLDKKQQNKEDQ